MNRSVRQLETGVLYRLLFLRRRAWELAIEGSRSASLWCSLLHYLVSKILESLIHKQLVGYFDGHGLQCKSQSGCRRKHPTETAVTYFADEILMNMDKGLVTNFVFIALAKAFDTFGLVNWSAKVLRDESPPWFENYFSVRKQLRVCIDSQTLKELAYLVIGPSSCKPNNTSSYKPPFRFPWFKFALLWCFNLNNQ